MKWMQAIGLGLVGFVATTPVYAAMSEAEQVAAWRSQLGRAYCAANWPEALSLAGALMGSEITPNERVWLFVLRQDMFNYQSGIADFGGCQGEQIVAGITAQEATTTSEVSSLNWQRGNLTNRRSASPSSATSRGNRNLNQEPAWATTPPVPVSQTANSNTACTPTSERDRRVANGTVSNRWAYEIWQDGRGFEARYWQQSQTCDRARTTGHHSTQSGAYEAFRRAATYNESRGVIQVNP
jgi:hypothetical protein